MSCYAIIECSKRSLESEQKPKLIEFIENFSNDVLENCEIERTSEMYTWKGTDWIDNIIENNPVIIDGIIDGFENTLNEGFQNYAIEIYFSAGHSVYELCGVYWHLLLDGRDFEQDGPSTDKDQILSLAGY